MEEFIDCDLCKGQRCVFIGISIKGSVHMLPCTYYKINNNIDECPLYKEMSCPEICPKCNGNGKIFWIDNLFYSGNKKDWYIGNTSFEYIFSIQEEQIKNE